MIHLSFGRKQLRFRPLICFRLAVPSTYFENESGFPGGAMSNSMLKESSFNRYLFGRASIWQRALLPRLEGDGRRGQPNPPPTPQCLALQRAAASIQHRQDTVDILGILGKAGIRDIRGGGGKEIDRDGCH
jgi:hypothetical protein